MTIMLQQWDGPNTPPARGVYMWFTGKDVFIVQDGIKIARRINHKWKNLHAGYVVKDVTEGDRFFIDIQPCPPHTRRMRARG